MLNKLKSTKISEIKREWHLLDAEGQIVGRLASKIAGLLQGKNKPYFVSYLDCGDYVVVVNAEKVKLSGRKEEQKKYTNYSGYPGGLKVITAAKLRERHPERIIERAVLNMLPKNKLRDPRMRRFKIFSGPGNPYKDKF